MTKTDFINEVEKLHFTKGCSISNAIDIVRKNSRVSHSEFISWFGNNKNSKK